jgi:hypothetical protein
MGKSREFARMPNVPLFAASGSGATSLAATSFTKVLFAGEEFDTNANFASSRFTPTVAGYYQINSGVKLSGTVTSSYLVIYKNGVAYKNGEFEGGSQTDPLKTVNALVYLNGSTDYVEIFAYNGSAGAINTTATSNLTWFDGYLARIA